MSIIDKKTRDTGKKVLKTVIKHTKNIDIIEKNIYKISTDVDLYNNILYQVVGDIINKKPIKDVLKTIKIGKVGINHEVFDDIKHLISEQDDFIVNPFEVEEGVTQCKKCESNRVFTYSKQVRSCDEPMTTFAQCVKCKSKWTYSG